jgi:hypothetical protein
MKWKRVAAATATATLLLSNPMSAQAATKVITVAPSGTTTVYEPVLGGRDHYCALQDSGEAVPNTADSGSFHSIAVSFRQLKVRQDGQYTVWLVELHKDENGNIGGCSANDVGSTVATKGKTGTFTGATTRFTGSYPVRIVLVHQDSGIFDGSAQQTTPEFRMEVPE